MDVLVVGCGSIGRRHINNLLAIRGIDRINIFTKRKDCPGLFGKDNGKLNVVKNLGSVKADFAILCDPTYKHAATAIKLARKRIPLFIEKPVARSYGEAEKVYRAAKKGRIKVAVGYNLRFLKALRYVKDCVASGRIGKPNFARIEAGQYLPDWRPYRDYRASYSAKKKMGGGVSLDLSHEIDYMRYIFGDPVRWKTAKARIGNLDIDCEDVFEGVYIYKNGLICSVHLDYLQRKPRRSIKVFGSRGSIECDIINKEIVLKRRTGSVSRIRGVAYFDIGKTYRDEIMEFIRAIRGGARMTVSLADGVADLKLLEDGHV
jgi:predicted dehydrogenase